MKNKFWFLTNYTFERIRKPLLLIAGLMVLAETTALFIIAGSKELYIKSYENMLDNAFVPFIFAFSVIAIIAVLYIKFHSFYVKQKGVYSLFTLPIKRNHILFSNILVSISTVLFLVVVQLVSVAILYFPIEAIANAVGAAVKVYPTGIPATVLRTSMDNGLFLSFIRNNFLRVLLPVDFQGIVILISLILTSSIIPIYPFSTNSDGSLRFWVTVDLILTSVTMSFIYTYGYISGFGFAFFPAIFILTVDFLWILSVLNQYKKSTMLYRGAK